MSRQQILQTVRAAKPPAIPLPPPYRPAHQPTGPVVQQFCDTLTRVGGHSHRTPRSALADTIADFATRYAPYGTCCNTLDPTDMPAQPYGVVIVRGLLGVAESGAVLIPASQLPLPSLPLIGRALVVILEETAIVADLHQAYQQTQNHIAASPYTLWVAGPSKTADIEKKLVTGAQGTTEHHVLLLRAAR